MNDTNEFIKYYINLLAENSYIKQKIRRNMQAYPICKYHQCKYLIRDVLYYLIFTLEEKNKFEINMFKILQIYIY